MKIELNLLEAVYFDFTKYNGEKTKSYLKKERDFKDGTSIWCFYIGLPSITHLYKELVKTILYTKVMTLRCTKDEAMRAAYHYMGYYTDFEKWAYELYKAEWCELHGYKYENGTAYGLQGSECYACIDEYLDNEYIEEKNYLSEIFDLAKETALSMVKEGISETTQGNWIFYFDELSKKKNIKVPENTLLIKAIRAYLECLCEEVSDVIVDHDSIDVNFYTNYCINIECE